MATLRGINLAGAGGGKGDAIFISAARRNANCPAPGIVRNVTFRDINVACEASAYVSAASSDTVVENVSISDCHLRFVRQGTQPTGWFDEQPSTRNSFPHESPALYVEGVKGLRVSNFDVEWIKPEAERWTGLAEIERSQGVVFFNVRATSLRPNQTLFKISDSEVELNAINMGNAVKLYEAVNSTVNQRG